MSVMSQVSNIVVERANQAEARIREGISQNARAVQESVKVAQSPSRAVAYQYGSGAFKVSISAAGMLKAAGRG